MKKGTAKISATATVVDVQNYVGLSDEEISNVIDSNQGNMDDWLIIKKIEDVVVGTSIPYNYEKSRF